MKYIRRHIFTLLTFLLIAALSLMPAQEFPQTDIQFADKWAHWVMYGFLTLVMGPEFNVIKRDMPHSLRLIPAAQYARHSFIIPIYTKTGLYEPGFLNLARQY